MAGKGPNLIRKYVWLVDTINRNQKISFDDLNKQWRENEDLSGGTDLPKRTFENRRKAIEEMFDINIENERCDEYRYYIENSDDLNNGGLRSWIINTFCVSNTLLGSQSVKDRILLEYVPSGQAYLQTIIEAMKENRVLNMTYHSFWKDKEGNYDVHPYCVKLFRQRWYMVAQGTYHDEPRIYALDRIQELNVKDETFELPKDWDANEYFDGSYGIITNPHEEKQIVKIKVSASQANYIRSLKIHESQEEVECNEEYSIFTFFLRPELDFQQELLKNGEDVEVIEPQWFRNEIGEKIKRMWDKYKRKK